MKTVKIFISSTFKDMNAERDVLTKNVFPRLREWAEETLGVLVQEVDLRWGVTDEQAGNNQVLGLCLEGIDECKPYFLCMLGKRYGWMPAPATIRKEVFESVIAAGSPLDADEKRLIRFAYPDSNDIRIRKLDIRIMDKDRAFVTSMLQRAEKKPDTDIKKIDALKGLVQQALEKAGVKEASISATEQEIRHVLDEDEIPWVIRDLDKAFTDIQLSGEEKELKGFFYKRTGSEPNWYLQPGYTVEEKRILAQIFEKAGLTRSYHSFFMFRKDAGEDLPDYIEKDATAVKKLASLKEYIKEIGKSNGPQKQLAVEEYPCAWNPNAGEGQHSISGLNAFGERVFELLRSHMASNPELKPDEADEQDDLTKERELHMRFVDSRTYNFRGREELLKSIEMSVQDGIDGRLVTNGKTTRYVMVAGEPGSGKSALMAKLYLNLMEHEKEKTSGVLILPWFVGASARSTGVTNLLGDYCATLARECNIADDIPGDPIELKKAFVEFLKKANRKVVILLDAVNQLRDGVQNGRVSWLPDELPENVCVLFSLVEDLRGKDGKANIEADKSFLEATRKRRTPSHEIKVKKLTEVEKQEIVASYLRQYNKNLSQDQKTKIVGKGESYNPLFLQVALEELRMVSRYEEVDSFISSGIKQTAEEMLGQTLERVEQEMEQRYPEEGCELFRRFMVLIAVGRNGMTEEDLRLLLGDWKGIDKNAGKEEKKAQVNAARLPDLKWSELRRSMRSYLFLSGDYWNFFHQQIKQAVEARYLDSEDKRREAHAEIAEYLTVMGYEHGTTARDLPYHLKQTEKTDELRAVLLTFKWTYEKLKAANVDELIVDYNLLDEREIKLMKSAIITSAHVLRHDFRQLPCQMYGRLLSYTADLWIGAFLNDIERWKEFPWLKPINICLAQAGGPLIRTLVGHKDYIVSVCITPDGKKVISSSQNDTLKVWDIDTGEELRTIVGLRHNVNCVKITPDGRIVISASDGKGVDTLKMWDIDTGEELWTAAGHCSNVKSLSITPDGKKAISESDNILIVWDIESGITLRTLRRCDFYNFGVCITPDGKRAVSKLNASALMVWNVDSGRKIRSFDGHDDEHVISSVCITPDGEKAIFVIGVNNIKFWDLNTGKDLKTLAGYRDGVDGLFVTPDGKYFIAISRNNTMDVWDLKTWTKINTLTGHSERISKVCITPDAKKAVSASWDHTLKVWDIENGELIMTLAGHGAWVTDVCTTLDGKIAVSASWDKTLKVWDINSREKNLPLAGHGNRVSGICITPDGKKAVSASWDNTLKVWDIETGIEVRSLVGHHDRITSVSITPDGERAITASDDHTLKIWNIDSGKEIRTLTGHNDRVRSLCITPDGKKAISASNSIQEHLIVWDIETGGMIRDFGGSNRYNANVSISPDGKNAITLSDDGDPEVREIETGKMVSEFELRDLYYKAKVNLYPAMKMAISITDDTLTVWDTDRVKVIRTIKGKNGYFGDACITPDGMRVVSASSDNTLNISDIETGEILISFIGENSLCSCQTTLDGSKIIAGDQGGKIYFLEVECTI